VNKVRYSPFSYRILAAQMKAAIQVSLVQGRDIDFPRKKAKRRHMYQSNGFQLRTDRFILGIEKKDKSICCSQLLLFSNRFLLVELSLEIVLF
jgi:hypothetical protein